MHTITIENFRAFGSKQQTCRLAPLTLLVGENSTGKTSFMALIRALWDVAYGESIPNFLEVPYDLGSFDNIVHNSGNSDGRVQHFAASFTVPGGFRTYARQRFDENEGVTFSVRFEDRDGLPIPTQRRIENRDSWIHAKESDEQLEEVIEYALNGVHNPTVANFPFPADERDLTSFRMMPMFLGRRFDEPTDRVDALRNLVRPFRSARQPRGRGEKRPYASAPIRSRPERTYNPGFPMRDPEGEHVPTYLRQLALRGGEEWDALYAQLVKFGQDAGLFEDMDVKLSEGLGSNAFELRVRTRGTSTDVPFRNLADVGYGVSQVLPVLTELLRADAPRMFLLQQPEVHLHPSAQAALGSLFCSLAASGKQLIVETHSDHLIDRVRMSVRDGVSGIKAEDVSILYFERNDLDVKIHSISIDRQGNIIGAPEDYRSFFMEEIERSVGLRKLNGES